MIGRSVVIFCGTHSSHNFTLEHYQHYPNMKSVIIASLPVPPPPWPRTPPVLRSPPTWPSKTSSVPRLLLILRSPWPVADGDQEKFDRLRAVEIKHGRIHARRCWIPCPRSWHPSSAIDLSGKTFASIPNGFAAFKEIPAGGLVQLLSLLSPRIVHHV
jgi:hypothetical protein